MKRIISFLLIYTFITSAGFASSYAAEPSLPSMEAFDQSYTTAQEQGKKFNRAVLKREAKERGLSFEEYEKELTRTISGFNEGYVLAALYTHMKNVPLDELLSSCEAERTRQCSNGTAVAKKNPFTEFLSLSSDYFKGKKKINTGLYMRQCLDHYLNEANWERIERWSESYTKQDAHYENGLVRGRDWEVANFVVKYGAPRFSDHQYKYLRELINIEGVCEQGQDESAQSKHEAQCLVAGKALQGLGILTTLENGDEISTEVADNIYQFIARKHQYSQGVGAAYQGLLVLLGMNTSHSIKNLHSFIEKYLSADMQETSFLSQLSAHQEISYLNQYTSKYQYLDMDLDLHTFYLGNLLEDLGKSLVLSAKENEKVLQVLNNISLDRVAKPLAVGILLADNGWYAYQRFGAAQAQQYLKGLIQSTFLDLDEESSILIKHQAGKALVAHGYTGNDIPASAFENHSNSPQNRLASYTIYMLTNNKNKQYKSLTSPRYLSTYLSKISVGQDDVKLYDTVKYLYDARINFDKVLSKLDVWEQDPEVRQDIFWLD
ncbi:MAG: hypothetical protein IKL46_07205 [Clostridia bacterium]|nr:hypothetical protein [Clostridia bacterium]